MSNTPLSTDWLRKHTILLSAHLGRSGVQLDYTLAGQRKTAVLSPYEAATILSDIGFVEGREKAGESVIVHVEEEATETREARQHWIGWDTFALHHDLSQYWAIQFIIRYEETTWLKELFSDYLKTNN